MRLTIPIGVLGAALASGQQTKHVTSAPANGSRPVTLNANAIVRTGAYPAVVHLTGNVQIKTPVCLPVGVQGKPVCDGYTIVEADEAMYNESSGDIEARGTVRVTPLAHAK